MKIGILTFHYAHNYGAVLQVFALRTYLRKMGMDVKVLNYKNDAILNNYRERLPYKYSLKDFLHVKHIPEMLKSLLNTRIAQEQWSTQFEKFNNFITKIILEGENARLEKKDLEKLEIDVFIAGSDQIWNPYLTGGLDDVYFLNFKTSAKKIFYGASNGADKIPNNDQEFYRSVFEEAYAISTREETLCNNIKTAYKKQASYVVDPTLLLDKKEYMQLIMPVDINEKFIFAYFITEDEMLAKCVKYISKILKLRAIELHYYKTIELQRDDQRADIGPGEFLFYMKNAEMVLTNSFHGTIFSIIFEKVFYSVYDKDARKDNLLRNLGLESRHISKLSQIDLNERIEYTNVRKKTEALRKESEEFISKILIS